MKYACIIGAAIQNDPHIDVMHDIKLKSWRSKEKGVTLVAEHMQPNSLERKEVMNNTFIVSVIRPFSFPSRSKEGCKLSIGMRSSTVA